MAIKELTFVVCFWIVCGHEFFSSTDQIAQLFEMKKNLLMSLSQCIDAEEKDVEMKSALQNLLLSYSESEDPEKAVRDPVAAYKLLRRLRNELITIIEHFQLSYQCNTYQDDFLEIPQMEDLDGAALGLIRLQEIYKFYPHNISNKTSLNADEAYHVGWVAYEERKFQHAFLWFLYSLNKLAKSSMTSEKELLYYLNSSAYWFGSLPQNYYDQELLNLDQITQLVEKKKDLLMSFSQYIDAEEKNIETMKSVYLNLLLSYSDPVDPEEIMRDPVAAYKFLSQQRDELMNIVKHIQPSFYQCNEYQDDLEFFEIPQPEDLNGAALGLIRLQEIYKLYPEDIMKEMSLSADEAYHVGLAAYNEDKFQHAFLWFLYSLDTLTEYSAITEEELLNVLIFSAYHFGSLPVAIYFNRELLNIDPTNEEVRDQLNILLHSQRTSNPDIFILNTESSNYEALCRGEVDERTSKRQRALSCRYSTGGGNPRLMYAPVKEEVEWDEPRIIRYHDIISDREIEILKNISRPLLSRSKVYEDGQGAISKHRVSQSVFLQDDPVSARVSQRIADATGLSVETAEPLLVQNYGIGGIFEPHYDALETGENDRIATFLIYMSDVEIGGATVFPDVGVAVQPEKVNP
ncbi:prolyl 4-hydroxylase subunit alpha-2-like [Onychostoma macrolepis]|uniref:prolyl 4-hydroxylase subunit alpha-2-like n=1 Tax=Onychostoma macrolepis TaxID=369639 RepID=UPI00272CCC7E|nr:prolyl 4-hydroxylase subunit alpha-2-like [Onychostoma macrolepis]